MRSEPRPQGSSVAGSPQHQGHLCYADERTRTSTELPPHGPEPCASTNSATSARERIPNIAHPRAGAARPGRRVGPEVRVRARERPTRFASLGGRHRAAIVQGTRTPPSHGGNPGSNPGSGTPKVPASGQVFSLSRPLTASPLGERSAARWGAEHRVTGRRRPAHPISACRSGVWPGEGSSEACARPGCRRRSKRALCWPADGDLKAAPIRATR